MHKDFFYREVKQLNLDLLDNKYKEFLPVTKAPLTGASLPNKVFLNKSVFLCSTPIKVVWSSPSLSITSNVPV